jgi:hypothetical protein
MEVLQQRDHVAIDLTPGDGVLAVECDAGQQLRESWVVLFVELGGVVAFEALKHVRALEFLDGVYLLFVDSAYQVSLIRFVDLYEIGPVIWWHSSHVRGPFVVHNLQLSFGFPPKVEVLAESPHGVWKAVLIEVVV